MANYKNRGGVLKAGDTAPTYTIAAGVITWLRDASYFFIDTESAASTDDLDTINGGLTGDIIVIRSKSSSRDPTVKDGAGNITCGSDHIMVASGYTMTLIYTGTTWLEISRSVN